VLDRQQNVAGQIYDHLRKKILKVELRPGDPINERGLADTLGASRTPIRDAIRRLSTEGLISTIPHVGTSVALIDAARLRECSFIRATLEGASIRLAAPSFSERDGLRLDDLVARQEATIEERDIAANIEVDVEFHRAILTLAGLDMTVALLDRIMGDIIRVRHLSSEMAGRLQTTISEHRSIVAALRSRDPDACEAALRAHLHSSSASIAAVLDRHPEYTLQAR
jgi:GntR family transcriptional regulator, rspAB operon transcriptional repressor